MKLLQTTVFFLQITYTVKINNNICENTHQTFFLYKFLLFEIHFRKVNYVLETCI